MSVQSPVGSNLKTLLEAYLQIRLPEVTGLRVHHLERVPGGASRETYRFSVTYEDATGPCTRPLILRRDLPASMLESDRRIEFEAFRAFADTPVPVPAMLWVEDSAEYLEHPFLIAEQIVGCDANPLLLLSEPWLSQREKIGRQKWQILGQIARADRDSIGYTKISDTPEADAVWSIALDEWSGMLRRNALRAEPVFEAVIRWMAANPPRPPAKISVVHGDYRSGNFLFDRAGDIRAILDWELTHLGDPLEDLAWSFSRMWCFARDDLRGGLMHRDDAIAVWEDSSGIEVDKPSLHWWELLAALKGQALWGAAGRNWLDHVPRETIHLGPPWNLMNRQDQAALELMENCR